MPARRLPNTTPAVIRTLVTARDKYKNTALPADRLISADQWAKLDDADPASFLSRFLKEAGERNTALASQAPLTGGLAQAAARLTMFCSHFHQVLDLGITRSTYPRGARTFYGRDIDAPAIPVMTNYADLTAVAEKIGSGETDRQTAEGAVFVAMSNPSAAEITAFVGPFKTLHAQSDAAQAQTNKEEEDVSAMYAEAHALAVDICDTVEFNVRQDPSASSRRSKARKWGVVYVNDDGTLAEDPLPPGEPPVTPPPA